MGYPGSVQTFTTKQDGVDYPQASHINVPQAEITAIETALLTDGLAHDLIPDGSTRQLGTSAKPWGDTVVASGKKFYLDGGTDTYLYEVSANVFALVVGATEVLRFATTGLATGLKFPATQVAQADVNTLDDYEEGTFTPAVAFGGGTTGITYGTSTARYLKVGRNVWVNGIVTLTNKGSSTGTARLTGLPFAEGDAANTLLTVMQVTGFSSVSVALGGFVEASGSVATLVQQGATGYSSMDNSNFSNTSAFYFSGWYRATA